MEHEVSSLVARLHAALLEALPPLHRRIRQPAASAVAHRLARLWRPSAEASAPALVPALREVLRALDEEVREVDQEAIRFVRAHDEAATEAERRQILIDHLNQTVPSGRERRADIRALKRWMGPDALRERFERRRQTLLVQEETALRALRGILRNAHEEDHPRLNAELPRTVSLLLDRSLRSTRAQNQIAAVEALAAALRVSKDAVTDEPEALSKLVALVGRAGATPWLHAAALEALLLADTAIGLTELRQRLHAPLSEPRDFLFRRQALETAARLLPADTLLTLLTEAVHDPSEYVRIGVCELLVTHPGRVPLLRRLAGLDLQAKEPSAKVRGAAVLAALTVARDRLVGWEGCLSLVTDVLGFDADPLVLRLACDLSARLSRELCDDAAQPYRDRLAHAIAALKVRGDLSGPVLEAAAAADLALARSADPARRAWTTYLAQVLHQKPSGSKVRVSLNPPPDGLPALPEEDAFLGAVLADLSQDDFGVYADRKPDVLVLWRGDRFERRAWRMWHEATRPAPNKRQGHVHTLGRRIPGTLRAHPAHMDEVTATNVPGERVHVASAGSWGRHLPTVDDLLDLPMTGNAPVQLFSSHGVTTLTPPASLSQRIKNKLRLSRKYENFAAMRLDALGGQEGRERRKYVDAVEQELGVAVSFTPYRKGETPPPQIASLFGGSARGEGSTLHGLAAPLALAESSWLGTVSDVLMERNEYFLGMRGNGILALALFTAGAFTVFLVDAYRKRQSVQTARAQIPLCIGGWGTRGKSGTERLKAALFNGLGFEIFAKTTGSEAMFVHAAPGGAPHEFFIYRPYDKATIWEQRDMVELGARMGVEVFLWECMALQPGFVELLQNDWMHDDLATLTNAYPDHEDIQGPAGQDVAKVITNFMPEGGKVITTEDHFLPLFRDTAERKGCELVHSAWWEAELIPQELLNLFPYQEHPRNMALVATMAEQLGIPRHLALGLMAEHVQPEIGVLKVFPRVRVRGRVLSFINGHSANERTGFLNNWKRTGLDAVDPNVNPDRAVVTVINNRWDRVARSEVFARIMVEDASADRHVLIGTNLEGLQKYVRDAVDEHLRRRDVLSAEDVAAGPAGLTRAEQRLGRELAHLKVPAPTAEVFFERLERYAAGAGLSVIPAQTLIDGVVAALEGADDASLEVSRIRAHLDKAIGAALEQSLVPTQQEVAHPLPEVLENADAAQVRTHALYLLARMVVHARLRAKLPRGAVAEGEVASVLEAYHRSFRTAWRELFLEQIVTVPDAHATGDQIIDICARSVAPGLEVSIMGAQNIKGTGLDWVYRWMALDKVNKALGDLENGADDARRRALEFLETFADNGLVDAGLAGARLPLLVAQAQNPEEMQRLQTLAERLLALHEVKVQALHKVQTGTRLERFARSVEKVFDYLDSVRRRKIADQLVDDLVHGRVSHARAALETRRLYERQKGGWLLPRKADATPQATRRPMPVLPETTAQDAFAHALEVPRDVSIKVPDVASGKATPTRAPEQRGTTKPSPQDSDRDLF